MQITGHAWNSDSPNVVPNSTEANRGSGKPSAIWHVQGAQAKLGPITNRKELVLADPILQNT